MYCSVVIVPHKKRKEIMKKIIDEMWIKNTLQSKKNQKMQQYNNLFPPPPHEKILPMHLQIVIDAEVSSQYLLWLSRPWV